MKEYTSLFAFSMSLICYGLGLLTDDDKLSNIFLTAATSILAFGLQQSFSLLTKRIDF